VTFGQPGTDRPGDSGAASTGSTGRPPEPVGDRAADAPSGAAGTATTDDAAPAGATASSSRRRRKPRLSFMQELPFLVLAALVLAVVIKAFVVQAFYIPSDSMEQTLHGCTGCHGDRVMVNKLSYDIHGIHRGDVVVFDGKDNYQDQAPVSTVTGNPVQRALHHAADWVGLAPEGTDYIKRVIGLPGDRVMCCDDQGRVLVNGHALDETYVYIDQPGYSMQFKQIVVPKDRVFVMGDHRNDSYDSRVPTVGSIPEKDVIGRAFIRIWPPSRWGWLAQPKTFRDWPKNAATAAASPLALSSALVLGARGAVGTRRRRRARRGR
jgi:signal peptidase I